MGYLIPVIAALCGALVGALLTSTLVHLATARRELFQSRLKVLIALMSGRANVFTPDVAGNINIIPILFHDKAKVRRAYQHFCAIPNGASVDISRRYDELVLAIAECLNFSDLSASDIDLGFYPLGAAGLAVSTAARNTRTSASPTTSADSDSP